MRSRCVTGGDPGRLGGLIDPNRKESAVPKLASLAALSLSTGGAIVAAAGSAHAVSVGNNWCAAPWSWPGPVSTNAAAFSYDTCNDQQNAIHVGPSGTNVGNNWCAAPWDWEGPLSENVAPFIYKACDNQRNDAPPMPVPPPVVTPPTPPAPPPVVTPPVT